MAHGTIQHLAKFQNCWSNSSGDKNYYSFDFLDYIYRRCLKCLNILHELSTRLNHLFRYKYFFHICAEGKALAASRDCKFIETSSGIQHNVDELLVGVLKQIRLRETRDKKRARRGVKRLHGSKTSLSLNIAREILHKMCLTDGKSKSCENLHVL